MREDVELAVTGSLLQLYDRLVRSECMSHREKPLGLEQGLRILAWLSRVGALKFSIKMKLRWIFKCPHPDFCTQLLRPLCEPSL